MNRTDDLEYTDKRLQGLQAEADTLVDTFKRYEAEIRVSVQEIVKAAGIWDEINELEMALEQTREKLKEKLEKLNAEAIDIRKIQEFLKSRVEETPVEVLPPVAPLKVLTKETGAAPPAIENAVETVTEIPPVPTATETPKPVYSRPKPVSPF